MSGPERKTAAVPKPPRPPNAWILYRSDKLRELAGRRNPDAPKRVQADISKEVSEMWRAEDPDVKREYERIADIKKQEHQIQYPHYKFQP
ncbi:high mobility group box domain-containing protein, partial [Fomitopsis betulina]